MRLGLLTLGHYADSEQIRDLVSKIPESWTIVVSSAPVLTYAVAARAKTKNIVTVSFRPSIVRYVSADALLKKYESFMDSLDGCVLFANRYSPDLQTVVQAADNLNVPLYLAYPGRVLSRPSDIFRSGAHLWP